MSIYQKVLNEYKETETGIQLKIGYKDTFVITEFDKDLFQRVSQRHWRVCAKRNKLYVISGNFADGSAIYLHTICSRKALFPKGYEIDHYDGNSLNNHTNNLRLVTRQENILNTNVRCDNKLKIRGVSYSLRDRNYVTDFSYLNNRFYSKRWNTIEEAIYCRYCYEKYFNLKILEHNEIAMQYMQNFDQSKKELIESYVLSQISQK